MKKALFLDRDGVINVEKNYLFRINDFEFIGGIFDLCRYYQSLGYIIVVVTNQSGIARGYYTKDDFNKLTSWMKSRFLDDGIVLKKVYFCPHHPDITGECFCRKPKPGMLLNAAKEFNIDLKHSVMIGDNERDVEAALNAGLDNIYLFDETKKVKKSRASKIVHNLKDIYC